MPILQETILSHFREQLSGGREPRYTSLSSRRLQEYDTSYRLAIPKSKIQVTFSALPALSLRNLENDDVPQNPNEAYKVRFALTKDKLLVGYEGRPSQTVPAHRQLTASCISAGNFCFNEQLKITKINHKSGDFRPGFDSLAYVLYFLANLDEPSELLDSNIKIESLNDIGGTVAEYTLTLEQIISLKHISLPTFEQQTEDAVQTTPKRRGQEADCRTPNAGCRTPLRPISKRAQEADGGTPSHTPPSAKRSNLNAVIEKLSTPPRGMRQPLGLFGSLRSLGTLTSLAQTLSNAQPAHQIEEQDLSQQEENSHQQQSPLSPKSFKL